MSDTVLWHGRDGVAYAYYVNSWDRPLRDAPGNYILVRRERRQWVPLYIGETESLRDRLTNGHDQWHRARRHGMTHIHAHVNLNGAAARRDEEADLLRHYRPVCNNRI